jgi:hypothetical protein
MSDPGQVNERGDGGPGALEVHPETIVLDRDGVEVLRIKGVVPLPIGTTIQLSTSKVEDVKVIGVRLVCAPEGQPAVLCLEVEAPPPGYNL